MTSVFYASDAVKKSAHGVKLINFDKGKVTVSEEGSQLLKSLDKAANLNACFIFGSARSGKSFLMNTLSGVPGLFKVVNSAQPCTRGVDISSYIVPQRVLAKQTGVSEAKQNPLVAFVDVEGQGAEDGTYDTILALPLLLTSKAVLFNHKGAPTVSDMLSKLGVLARAAEYIDLSDSKDSKEAPETVSVSNKKFGHLHVLFRDFSFEGNVKSVFAQLMDKEKVQRTVRAGPGAGIDPAKAAEERNNIRQLLLDNFESINVWLFKQPASADDLLKHQELPGDKIDAEFAETVSQLLQSLAEQLGQPMLFNGRPLSGPRLEQLLTQVTAAINEGGVINVPSVFRAMEKETVNRVANECLALFETAIKSARNMLPLAVEILKEKLIKSKDSVVARFDAELLECTMEDEKKAKRDEMLNMIARSTEELLKDNGTATLKRVRDVITKHATQARLEFEAYCKQNMPMEDSKALEARFNLLKDQARKLIGSELADLPEVFKTQEYNLWLLEAEEALHEFLTRKTIENESVLKDATIEKLRLEAIRQQQLLIEQNKKLEKYIADEKKNTESLEQELKKLADAKAVEEKRNKEIQEQLAQQQKKIEELQKRKKGNCVIL